MNGKTIRIYLVDGVPTGLRHALLAESHRKHGKCVVTEPANKAG